MTPIAFSPTRLSLSLDIERDPARAGAEHRLDARLRPVRAARRTSGVLTLTHRGDIDAALKNRSLRTESVPAALEALAARWRIDMPPRVGRDIERVFASPEDGASRRFGAWEARACPPRALTDLQAYARSIVQNRLALSQTRAPTTFDLIEEIAQPLWPDVLAAWCGLAEQQRRRLHHLGRALQLALVPGKLTAAGVKGAIDAIDELHRIFAGAYRQPRNVARMPSLFASLESSWTPALGPIDDVIVTAAMRILLRGGESVPGLIGDLVNLLIDRRELAAQLQARPDTLAPFVAEALHQRSPMRIARRIALRDTRVGDIGVRQGETVLLVMPFAGQDEAWGKRDTSLDLVHASTDPFDVDELPPLAQMQVQAVLEVLLPCFDRIDRSPRGATWQTRSGLKSLEHLVLRLRV
jgi:cytochrome P450